jgi:hypothetical protein
MSSIAATTTKNNSAHAPWCALHDPAYGTCVTEMRTLPGGDDAIAWAETTDRDTVTVYVDMPEDGITVAQLDELIAALTELRATVAQ